MSNSDSIPREKVEILLTRVEQWSKNAVQYGGKKGDEYYQGRVEAYGDVISAIKQVLSE